MAEFHVHGEAVIKEIQNSLSKIPNLRLAEAGEFTKLAFQNGKINLLKAKCCNLISSETKSKTTTINVMSGKVQINLIHLRETVKNFIS